MSAKVQVWLDEDGTTAECNCGWSRHMPSGVMLSVITGLAEHHLTSGCWEAVDA